MSWYFEVVINKYATFSGRARRKEFWMFQLFNLIVSMGLGIVLGITAVVSGIGPKLIDMGTIVYALAIMIPTIAVAVRRMHDLGRSGWWILFPVLSIVFLFFDSEPGTNAYGPNPKGRNSAYARA